MSNPDSFETIASISRIHQLLQTIHQEFLSNSQATGQTDEKVKSFEWTLACQTTFDESKKRITEASILAHFDPELKTIVETDSSDYLSADVLSQKGKNEVIRFDL